MLALVCYWFNDSSRHADRRAESRLAAQLIVGDQFPFANKRSETALGLRSSFSRGRFAAAVYTRKPLVQLTGQGLHLLLGRRVIASIGVDC